MKRRRVESEDEGYFQCVLAHRYIDLGLEIAGCMVTSCSLSLNAGRSGDGIIASRPRLLICYLTNQCDHLLTNGFIACLSRMYVSRLNIRTVLEHFRGSELAGRRRICCIDPLPDVKRLGTGSSSARLGHAPDPTVHLDAISTLRM